MGTYFLHAIGSAIEDASFKMLTISLLRGRQFSFVNTYWYTQLYSYLQASNIFTRKILGLKFIERFEHSPQPSFEETVYLNQDFQANYRQRRY